jgi:hypothetical protein
MYNYHGGGLRKTWKQRRIFYAQLTCSVKCCKIIASSDVQIEFYGFPEKPTLSHRNTAITNIDKIFIYLFIYLFILYAVSNIKMVPSRVKMG